jgi:HEPN domain-containing protein
MKPLAREWAKKAEADFRSAKLVMRGRFPNYDLVCFLSQQCAEKYLKARLVEAGLTFQKTHDLEALLDAAARLEPHLESFRKGLAALTDHAVEFRYPGEWATKEMAKTDLAHCRDVRKQIRKSLGLDEPPSGQMKLQIKERRGEYRVQRGVRGKGGE